MSLPDDPRRLRDDPDAPAALRTALDAARADGPDAAALAALAARLGLGPDGGGADGNPPVAPPAAGPAGGQVAPPAASGAAGGAGAGLGPLLGPALVAVGVMGGVVWWAGRPAPVAGSAPPRVVERAPAPPAPAAALEPPMTPATEPPAPPPMPVPAPRSPPTTDAPPTAPPAEDALSRELALVERAQAQLAGDPAAALSACEAHAAQFPDGLLAQEREAAAVQALVALGRNEAARARLEAFAARWPRSAHLERLRRLE